MKRYLQTIAFGAVLGTGLILTYVYTASAGFFRVSNNDIFINPGIDAFGALGWVHNSTDQLQYLHCSIQANKTGSALANCSAGDKSNPQNTLACSTSDPYMLIAASKITSDSYVYFSRDANGLCTEIQVFGGSYFSAAF
jgi:cellulase/cellobiase CelA1